MTRSSSEMIRNVQHHHLIYDTRYQFNIITSTTRSTLIVILTFELLDFVLDMEVWKHVTVVAPSCSMLTSTLAPSDKKVRNHGTKRLLLTRGEQLCWMPRSYVPRNWETARSQTCLKTTTTTTKVGFYQIDTSIVYLTTLGYYVPHIFVYFHVGVF